MVMVRVTVMMRLQLLLLMPVAGEGVVLVMKLLLMMMLLLLLGLMHALHRRHATTRHVLGLELGVRAVVANLAGFRLRLAVLQTRRGVSVDVEEGGLAAVHLEAGRGGRGAAAAPAAALVVVAAVVDDVRVQVGVDDVGRVAVEQR